MRNNLFYILIICAFTEILTKNEEKKPAGKEVVKHTREFYEEEAKKDIQNLLSSLKNRNFSEDDEDDTELLNAPRSKKIIERFDEILKKKKSKKDKQINLRSTAQITAENFRRGALMQNSPLNLRKPSESSSNLHNSVANNNQFLQLMNRLMHPNSDSVKSRISGGHNVNNTLRNSVNHVNIKPEVYPVLIAEDKYGSREISSEEVIQISDKYYADDEDGWIKLPNKVDTEHKNQSAIRTATVPVTKNFDLEELLNQLHIKRGEVISTRTESDNNVRLHDFLNKFYSPSTNHLRAGNRVQNAYNHLDELDNNIDPKDNSKTIFLRSDVIDVNPSANGRLDEFKKYLDIAKDLRFSHNTLSHGNSPQPVSKRLVRRSDGRGRQRRSTNTQAGYTQDPDTCKTYNEELVKLWSNLSKLANVTEQPNERALHNIAMIIHAYLEHHNAKHPPQRPQKEKHEGPRDKISEVLLKIRKLLEEAEGSATKITKIIIKYLKPDYTYAETEGCQEANEEYLGLSVDLLYKNYLENTDCEGEDDSMARNKKLSLRGKQVKTGTGHMPLSLASSDFKPEFQTVLIENELYDDFHKGKIPRQRPTNKYRRAFKPNRNKRSHHANRSGNQNESEKLQTRSKASSKSSSKKLKKSSLKSNLVKSKCEKYLTRKLIISLRPVMERFIGLLECQLDHTLRSVDFGKDSKIPYYAYASKFYSNEDSRRHRKIWPRLLAKNTGRKRNKSHKKLHTKRHHSSVEHDRDVHERDDETDSAWVRKYSFDQINGMNSETPAATRDTDARESDTENNKQHETSDYLTSYNEYFQSPPIYDDYDGIYKTHQITNSNGFPSLINPSISLNDKKNTRDKSTNQNLASSDKEKDKDKDKNDVFEFLEDSFSEESNHPFNFGQQTEPYIIEEPFTDLTKLRNDDQFIEEKSKVHVKSFESLTEFLKRARDASLQTPEFAVPFALDTNKGYVELTHLIKYPKMLVYRPQFLVKNTMPYDDFLKTINNINMTNEDVRLMKIVRHLPDSSVQVLFETEDFEAPLEVRNLNDNRRSGSPDPVVNHQFESRMEPGNENTNADLVDGDSEDFIPIIRKEASRKVVDTLIKLDSFNSDEDSSPDFNPDSKTLRVNDEESPNMYFDYNSDTNLTVNSKPNSSESSLWFSPLPSFSSGLFNKNPSSDSGQDVGSAVGSASGSQIGSGMQLGLDTALNLGFKMNPHSSQLGSFFSKLLSSHSNTQSTSNPSSNSQSHMNSHFDSSSGSLPVSNSYSQLNSHFGSLSNSNSGSHSLLAYPESSNKEVGHNFLPSTKPIFLRWWKKWKNVVKGKIKQIIGNMASLADKIDHIVKL